MQTNHHPVLALPKIQQIWVGGNNVGGAVYGSIIVIAVIGAWHADTEATAMEALTSTLATVVVFWFAHVYAHWVAEGIASNGDTRQQIYKALAHDWPIVQSCALPALVLLTAPCGWLTDHAAMRFAMGGGVGNLFLYGLWAARTSGRPWWRALPIASFIALMGLGIVVLEIKLG